MKNSILITILFCSLFSVAQTSIRVINLDVKMGEAPDVARLFAEYHDVERKSGAAVLQSVNYLKGATHRILFAGDPANWGEKVKKTDAEWEAYTGKLRRHFNGVHRSMVLTNLRWRDNNREKNKASKHWEVIVANPEQFLAAYDKFIKAIEDVMGDRGATVTSIDMGGMGGTHSTSLKGRDLNDLVLLERAIQKTKAFQDFIKERGEVKLVQSYFTNNIHLFNRH
ncbi:MAG TPA: hypothetical protein DCR42_06735 [Flavobacteriaceae bacterium]|jgi:hypothetical protein|nr:hypothetical protein [Flavobacteriaceae bacterium]